MKYLILIFLLNSLTVNAQSGQMVVSSNSVTVDSATIASLSSSIVGAYTVINTKWTKLSSPLTTTKKLVFIGSSTTAGYGTSIYVSGTTNDSSFVGRVLNYYFGLGLLSTKTGCNLGVSSTDIFDGQPSWYVPTGSQHSPLAGKNITAALALNPNIVMVSYPSNSYDFLSITEIMQGHRRIKATCDSAGVVSYFATTMPRTGFSASEQNKLVEIRDSIISQFPNNYIDFYKVAESDSIPKAFVPSFAFGDGVHLNDAGHKELAYKVISQNMFSSFVSSNSVITTPTSTNTTISSLNLVGVNKFQISQEDTRGLATSSISSVTVLSSPWLLKTYFLRRKPKP